VPTAPAATASAPSATAAAVLAPAEAVYTPVKAEITDTTVGITIAIADITAENFSHPVASGSDIVSKAPFNASIAITAPPTAEATFTTVSAQVF
jgi:hypothetical protein